MPDRSKTVEANTRRKTHHACDFCRRRKARCDGFEMPDNRCTNCISGALTCTYREALRRRPGYVKSLETRLEQVQKLISKLCPTAVIGEDSFDQKLENDTSLSTTANIPSSKLLSSLSVNIPTKIDNFSVQDESGPSDDECVILGGDERSVGLDDRENSMFLGKSSEFNLVQNVLHLKRVAGGTADNSDPLVLNPLHRPEYRFYPPWTFPTLRSTDFNYRFPELSLLYTLVDCYFRNVNIFFPLLHRPTFEQSLVNDLHLRDHGFGATVLLVCALGTRFSKDRRIVHSPTSQDQLPTGWQYYHQVRMLRVLPHLPQSIYELQVYGLAACFLECAATSQGSWHLVGEGLRHIQDVGAHRRKMYGSKPSVESELWKRAFWVLLVLDRLHSSNLGRPCALQDEDFDVDLPTECDDEYWTHIDPEQAFKQPPGKPSKMTFFIMLIRLNQILGFALRTIYSIKKSKTILGHVGKNWHQRIVSEMDSDLNKWFDLIPDFLRWDANISDDVFVKQSAILHCHYYEHQIVIHRPFIQTSRKSSPLTSSSMTICTTAARSCCRLLHGSRKRIGLALNQCIRQIFTCCAVLIVNLWSRVKGNQPVDEAKEMEDIKKCLLILQICESRWIYGRRFRDILRALLSTGEIPFYRHRKGLKDREYLFLPDFTDLRFDSPSPLPEETAAAPEPIGNQADDQLTSKSGFVINTDQVPEDSEEIYRLPPHLEALFFDAWHYPLFPTQEGLDALTTQHEPYITSQTTRIEGNDNVSVYYDLGGELNVLRL